MSTAIAPQHFKNVLLAYLDETFDVCHGNFLDPNNGILYTLGTITAKEASIPVGGKCASLAAQVAHLTFFIELFEKHAIYHDDSRPDWGEVWRTVEKVTPEEWETLKEKLKQAYLRMDQLFRANDDWDEDRMGGALSVIIHSAYHLGEIRQALCVLKK